MSRLSERSVSLRCIVAIGSDAESGSSVEGPLWLLRATQVYTLVVAPPRSIARLCTRVHGAKMAFGHKDAWTKMR